ncbi:hypothetical protein, partial [Stenoxybacter acetivorans]|uniref:hypothetical protein n=1 Tax=Stenoxybacter acetivorans TaxID=422441 RepID=UPI00056AD429
DIYIIEPKFNLKWIFGSLTAIIALAFIKPQLAYFLFCCWLVWNAMHIELVHRYKKGKNVQSLGLSVAKMFLRNIFIALMLHYIVFDILIHISAIRIVIFYIYTTLEMIFKWFLSYIYVGASGALKTAENGFSLSGFSPNGNLYQASMTIMTILALWQFRHFYFHAWAIKNQCREKLDYEYGGEENRGSYFRLLFMGLWVVMSVWVISILPGDGSCTHMKASISCLNTISMPISMYFVYFTLWFGISVTFNEFITFFVRNIRCKQLNSL